MNLFKIFTDKNRGFCKACAHYNEFDKACTNKLFKVNVKKNWESWEYVIPHPKELNKNNDCVGWKQGFTPHL